MTEKLKFTVIYTRTVNRGNYESARIGLHKEFYRGECSAEEAFTQVKRDVENMIDRREES